MLTCDRN